MKIVSALIVKQWLPEWDQAKFEPAPPRGKPEPQFYVCSMAAYELKKLTGIYRRDPDKPPAEDLGIQRSHDPDRSAEILRYLQTGFPLSRIQAKKLVDPGEIPTLRMPGWLPSAIVVNILKPTNRRGVKGKEIAAEDLVTIEHNGNSAAKIHLPAKLEGQEWQPVIHPIEVIDGQHRLWALEEPEEDEGKWSAAFRAKISEIEIPVIAFHGLDTTWQAYLFYTINQLATKIDTSMVFDLYPLLRTEEWLLRFEGPNIYRQTRAQDLTILLWSHPESPWKDRIIRLGGRERGKISQAAFINSLMSSFIRRYTSISGTRIGGLFGSRPGSHEIELNWVREQQAAFLIVCWKQLRESVIKTDGAWATALLNRYAQESQVASETRRRELLFSGPDTLLGTDQGVRGYMNVLNDLLWIANEDQKIDLRNWSWVRKVNQNDNEAITDALHQFQAECQETMKYVGTIAEIIAKFDWRLPSALSHTDPSYSIQAMYRGSSGYSEIRRRMVVFIKDAAAGVVSDIAAQVLEKRGYGSEDGEI